MKQVQKQGQTTFFPNNQPPARYAPSPLVRGAAKHRRLAGKHRRFARKRGLSLISDAAIPGAER